jgi:hypothetical protein
MAIFNRLKSQELFLDVEARLLDSSFRNRSMQADAQRRS